MFSVFCSTLMCKLHLLFKDEFKVLEKALSCIACCWPTCILEALKTVKSWDYLYMQVQHSGACRIALRSWDCIRRLTSKILFWQDLWCTWLFVSVGQKRQCALVLLPLLFTESVEEWFVLNKVGPFWRVAMNVGISN